ncbi:carbohydrate ABC transporter permease [Microbispora corallina]|uniref:Sugar ABC transporter permease n=1 Tax=Microbispora corallina TaxID=83302 RepID=A0ABQ4FZN1_9ACTN|nr:carbohydrate ABC transporter permease [Microbispora corallina]GIH40188.1 sugar ABC transporter permease [Microbispora corallina]
MTRRRTGYYVLMYAIGAVLLAAVFGPILWLVISSLSTQAELLSVPTHFVPDHPTLARYQEIFTGAQSSVGGALRAAMVNSLVVATATVVISGVAAVFGAYAFARVRFRGKTPVLLLFLGTYMMPPLALVIPLYLIMANLGLLDTRTGLVLVNCTFTTPFLLWLLSNYFAALPVELEDAAQIDGLSRLGALFRIVLPIARPGLVTAAIMAFLASWDEFFYALIFTDSPAAKTVPVALSEFVGKYASLDFGLMAAGGVVALVPPVVFAVILQRQIMSGLAAGAVK